MNLKKLTLEGTFPLMIQDLYWLAPDFEMKAKMTVEARQTSKSLDVWCMLFITCEIHCLFHQNFSRTETVSFSSLYLYRTWLIA